MVLWSGGWCFLLLALFYGAIDVLGWRAWAFPLVVVGANPLLAYVLSHLFIDQIDGMGLGLATVASLIWGSGGDCRLANRVDREGVIFEIVLPSMNLDNPPSRPVVN